MALLLSPLPVQPQGFCDATRIGVVLSDTGTGLTAFLSRAQLMRTFGFLLL